MTWIFPSDTQLLPVAPTESPSPILPGDTLLSKTTWARRRHQAAPNPATRPETEQPSKPPPRPVYSPPSIGSSKRYVSVVPPSQGPLPLGLSCARTLRHSRVVQRHPTDRRRPYFLHLLTLISLAKDPAAEDNDSAYGDDVASSTASLSTSILRYRTIHGRTFHSDKGNADYWTPNDERQNESMDIK